VDAFASPGFAGPDRPTSTRTFLRYTLSELIKYLTRQILIGAAYHDRDHDHAPVNPNTVVIRVQGPSPSSRCAPEPNEEPREAARSHPSQSGLGADR
jgi:hypothetical protein